MIDPLFVVLIGVGIFILVLIIILFVNNLFNSIFDSNYRILRNKLGKPKATINANILNLGLYLMRFDALSIDFYKDSIVFHKGIRAIWIKDFSSIKLSEKLDTNIKIKVNNKILRIHLKDEQYKFMKKYLEEHNV